MNSKPRFSDFTVSGSVIIVITFLFIDLFGFTQLAPATIFCFVLDVQYEGNFEQHWCKVFCCASLDQCVKKFAPVSACFWGGVLTKEVNQGVP
ncbi:hypothetical protein FKM82_007213 [Ascaphus truei]